MNHLFLYSPFTNEVIRFPGLERGFNDKASFYLNPASAYCMVISLSVPKVGKLEISTCQSGDESWKTFGFCGDYYCICDVGYINESFYCSFTNGKLGAFNIKQQEWKVLWNLQSEPSPPITDSYRYLAVAFNGDLIMGCCNRGCLSCASWRFDLSERKWVAVENEITEKQVIFRGRTFSSSFSIPAEGNASESAGKINYFDYDYGIPWSISFNCVDIPRIWRRSPDYVWMEDDNLRKIWIQPPSQRILRASNLLQSGPGLIPKDKST
ncbi:hypothetical protein Dsin_009829 [Dipteronia sinensis]|uniref:KIB1-4 beta-propeller domain-containing protein n=1 Tax=Dipteronia sinensis TaxID=43782 RepID=A0AAE0ECA9_9ROSI|nr:hypothetical protein Dsin_009829 [Dipteronia sinensis]